MRLRSLKLATFKHAVLATLTTAVNDYTAGKAVAVGVSGTFNYAAGEVAERVLVGQEFWIDGGVFFAALWFTEVSV
jgi:hypothetical protein